MDSGHRSVGGIRASIYNAFPMAGVEALVAFMKSLKEERIATGNLRCSKSERSDNGLARPAGSSLCR